MTIILPRRGTAAQWTTANPVLQNGELGYETDTGNQKIGNGILAWSSLPYRGFITDSSPSLGGNLILSSFTVGDATAADLTALHGRANGSAILTVDGTQTISNKRIDPRMVSAASASSVSPSTSTADIYAFTALAANLTINAPTGTADGVLLRYRFKDNGTSRTLTWNAIFRAISITIPTATTTSKTLYVDTVYNAADTKWDVIRVALEA